MKALETIFEKYAKNTHKMATPASSQQNESFHNVMAHKSKKTYATVKARRAITAWPVLYAP